MYTRGSESARQIEYIKMSRALKSLQAGMVYAYSREVSDMVYFTVWCRWAEERETSAKTEGARQSII